MNAPTHDALLKPRSLAVTVVLVVAVAIALVGVVAGRSGAAAGDTTRVNVSSSGTQANGGGGVDLRFSTSISSDGRYVAFGSNATNLVWGDTNGRADVFVHDRQTGTTRRVSVSSSERQADGNSYWVSISPDGRYVAFASYASNLVRGDTNHGDDVFVRDRQTGTTRRVSVSSSGKQAKGVDDVFSQLSISSDGRYVAFSSYAYNLVRGDTNRRVDIFVRDRSAGTTKRVSVSNSGVQAKGDSVRPSISSDGRYVAFESYAYNLVPNDTNGKVDVFVHEF